MSIDHYENFPVASILLPARLRPAVEAIYRFARSADDLADEGDTDAAQRLAALTDYEQALQRIEDGQPAHTPLFERLGTVVKDYAHLMPDARGEISIRITTTDASPDKNAKISGIEVLVENP